MNRIQVCHNFPLILRKQKSFSGEKLAYYLSGLLFFRESADHQSESSLENFLSNFLTKKYLTWDLEMTALKKIIASMTILGFRRNSTGYKL